MVDSESDLAPVVKSGRFAAFGRLAGWKKALIVLSALVLVIAGGLTGGGFYLYHRYEDKVDRAPLMPSLSAEDAKKTEENWASGPLNLLLLGSDSRAEEVTSGVSPIGERSDTIMVLHISKNRDRAVFISIPRDSYVEVPPGGSWNGGKNKINSAFAFGGTPLTAETVQKLTGVTLDGAMVADFGSIREMVDAVGGINVCIEYRVRALDTGKVWEPGCHDMDGATALEFVRQRHGVIGGDFGRMHNQQLVVKSLISKVSSSGTLTNPLELDSLLGVTAGALTVDDKLDLRDLAFAVRGIRPGDIDFRTVPYSRADLDTSAGTAVQLDAEASASMFAALAGDTIDQWLDANPPQVQAGT
ncbi:LCP family protein required for cell wall assembly [Actinoplanes lutulentus]|uniref:LytR family transcriptional attenuator n=1 Tax=Actinoplanes lutulentus TaxID=1287878 RepID=A0A327ZKA9_9ACTN|nr:LCP family protein [Actinoplanes lutulentus]MBB2944092.1 LCP family protein required for cell wall assembly [Actinoplanes lutulentus]RAK42675.1 LytR family transcriptional attenuator [Actinoplanes lutulentus]